MNTSIKFFLGANSKMGFISYFGQLQDQKNDLRLLILKGGPGCGKSSLMRRVCEYAEKKGNEIILIPCASDTESIDSFIDITVGFAMIDGTSPHIADPILPGVSEHIFNMGEFWDSKKLSEKQKEISDLTERISHCHMESGAYIKSAAALYEENLRHARSFINKKEIYGFSEKIIKELPKMERGKEYKALLSAVSVGKTVFFDETLSAAKNIYAVSDKWGAGADYLMNLIKEGALAKGNDVIMCRSSIIPSLTEHIITGGFDTAVTTEKRLGFPGESLEISYKGIYFTEEMQERNKLYSIIIEKACSCVKKAKLLHDKLEAYYREAMDFSKADVLYQKIIKEFY